jgi:hypothetical protein
MALEELKGEVTSESGGSIMQRVSVVLASAGLLLGGCASMFMNGGKLVDDPSSLAVKASFVAPNCTASDGSPISGPSDIMFQLVQDGPQLAIFERSRDGSGAVITNTWADAQSDHYFGWVQRQGWEYVIPRVPGVQPMRLVYVNLSTINVGTVTKPMSAVSATCPLVPAK